MLNTLLRLKGVAGSARHALWGLVLRHQFFDPVRETKGTENPIAPGQLLGYHWRGRRGPYWPVHKTSMVRGSWTNVHIGVDVTPGASPGCYIQGIGTIRVGDYTEIGPQVGIISANHDMHDVRIHLPGHVEIGRYCWLGMGSLIMPNVTLGDFTIVAAGAVVTKCFPEGHVVIGGNPARPIQQLDVEKCVRYDNPHKYHGFLSQRAFQDLENRLLNPVFRNRPAPPRTRNSQ
jgi:acetyltransferase-like isoleucine patch superfamily enzyme